MSTSLKPVIFRLLRLLHRYVGLGIAGFLILAALTGSLLAFMPQLERLSAPHLYSDTHAVPLLSFSDYAEIAENHDHRIAVTAISYQDPGRVTVNFVSKINPDTNKRFFLDFSEMFLDPGDGSLLGVRQYGDLSDGWQNIMPFIYLLHYSLILGDAGWWLMGIIAVLWTIDCFNGLLITWPARGHHSKKTNNRLRRWGKAWLIKSGTSAARFNFDLHRALSLWLWLVLLIFAWSSVYMNLWGSFYLHITRSFTEFNPPWYHLADRRPTADLPILSWPEVEHYVNIGLQEVIEAEGIRFIEPNALFYIPSMGAYRYRVQSDRDLSSQHVRTEIYIDANTGKRVFAYIPTGKYTGNTISSWLHTLHRARIWGAPFQIFVFVLGFTICIVSVTGVLIWGRRLRPYGKRRSGALPTKSAES